MKAWPASLGAFGLAVALGAGTPQQSLDLELGAEARLENEAAFLNALLRQGGAVYFKLPAEALPSRDAQGRWRPEPLRAALSSDEPLVLGGDTDAAAQGLSGLKLGPRRGRDEGRWLMASAPPRILLVENSSTVAPLSKGLRAWRWPFELKDFSDVEADPGRWLDPASVDLVVFSSPGWWDDFANPPGGPSRMPAKVLDALRNYVRRGGAAVFVDIAQWDLEKAWPQSVRLSPLGPYAVSKLGLLNAARGGLSLAPVGVAADRLVQTAAFDLGGSAAFEYPDGRSRPLHAAYAMPDPGGGTGWVAGLAFHVFEQEDTLAPAARRLLLNLLLLSGDRRLAAQGEPKAPPPPVATATRTLQRSATATPTVAPPTATEAPTPEPTYTAIPTATPIPTAVPTAIPALAMPTLVPTLVVPTLVPATAVPTLVPPTAVPTLVPPTAVPTLIPATAVPARIPPTAVPTLAPPTAIPTRIPPTAVPTLAPPTAVPTRIPPTPVPPPRPTLVPMRVWSTPVPTWTRPTPLPTLPPPTPQPTWVRPTALPTWPAPPPLPTALPPALPSRATPRPTRVPATAIPTLAPTPRLTPQLTAGVRNALGCLSSAPEPFGEGGVYLRFCLRVQALVQVQVFDLEGKQLWASGKRRLAPGDHQWHFEGWVSGSRLPPGAYLYQVHADYGEGQAESRQGRLTRGRDRRR